MAILGLQLSLPFSTATSLLNDRGRAAAPMDTPPWTAAGMSLLYPITAEIKQKPHPQTSTFTPNSGNPSKEWQNRAQVGATGQGQPSVSHAQGPGFCCPLFWDCPVQSQELDLILVFLSNLGYPRIAPRAALSLLPILLPGQGCLRSTMWEQPRSPALKRSLQLPLRAKG